MRRFQDEMALNNPFIRIATNIDFASEPLHREELFNPPELVNGCKWSIKSNHLFAYSRIKSCNMEENEKQRISTVSRSIWRA